MNGVFEGQSVKVPWKGQTLQAIVVCAAGRHARVSNPLHGIDAWVDTDTLTPASGPSQEEPFRRRSSDRTISRSLGRTKISITCPYCQEVITAFLWSLAGSGKRCPCGAMHRMAHTEAPDPWVKAPAKDVRAAARRFLEFGQGPLETLRAELRQHEKDKGLSPGTLLRTRSE